MPSASEDVDPSSPEVLLAFYRRLYPFRSIFAWLNHEHTPTKQFTHREFAFTLQGDVYLRYNSFAGPDELKKQICTLVPTRFEIGPVYSARPRDKKTVRPAAFTPLSRELVIDIDMTDYDAIRTCCSGAGICRRCWVFISAAVRVLHSAITTQFGWEHLLWVYSGRRGIHLWVSDKEAMDLTDEGRRAVVGWLGVIAGGGKESGAKKVNVRIGGKLPPSLQSALVPLVDVFGDLILADQDCFKSQEGWQMLLQLLPNPSIVSSLQEQWATDPGRSSEDKWNDIKDEVKGFAKGTKERTAMQAALEDIILQYTYPRLDAEVTKHRNHLLKAPFCIHPKTGRVCVPVDPEKIDEFDPEAVPTIGQLLGDLDKAAADKVALGEGEKMEVDSAGPGEHHRDWEKTRLKPYVEMLDRYAQRLMDANRRAKKEKTDVTW